MKLYKSNKPRYLITGASSFSGSHLVQHLRDHSDAILFGCSRSNSSLSPIFDEWQRCDVGEAGQVETMLDRVQPTVVFHLAGSTDAFDAESLLRTNVTGTWNVLNGCMKHCERKPMVLLVGSAAEYGEMQPGEESLDEGRTPCPAGLYGFSRHAALELGKLAHRQWGLRTYLCRPFNLIGPGLPNKYAPTMIMARMMAARMANESVFNVLNGGAIRDFIDVRDVVRAWALIVERGRPGVPYCVGTGIGTSIGDLTSLIAQTLGADLEVVGISGQEANERSGSQRSVANPSLLLEDTGFTPQISIEQSLRDMLNAFPSSS